MKKIDVSITENNDKTFTIKVKLVNNKNATKDEITYAKILTGYINNTIKEIFNGEGENKNE